MRVCVLSNILILLLVEKVFSSRSHMQTSQYEVRKTHAQNLGRRAVTEEEISHIASILQPRECLSLLYLLHHAYNRRRRRKSTIEEEPERSLHGSAQITPCETMLLNYWRDPRSRNQRDCSQVTQTLRQVKRDDLAKWLWGRRHSCPSRILNLNGTQDAATLTAQMEVMPIYSGRTAANRTPTDSTLVSMIWIYIALAVCTTMAVLLCIHYLFTRFRQPRQYISLADKDIRNLQYVCGCIDKEMALAIPGNKKKRYPHLPQAGCESTCGCSGN